MLSERDPLAEVDLLSILIIEETDKGKELSEVDDAAERLHSALRLLLCRREVKDIVYYLQVLCSLYLQLVGVKVSLNGL